MAFFERERFNRRPAEKRFSSQLRGFGPAGLFFLITILITGTVLIGKIAVPVGAFLVLLWVKLSKTPWRDIGYTKPASWTKTIFSAILFGCTFKLLTKAVVMPLLGAGPVNLQLRHLTGNTALLPYAFWAMLVAGWAEETVYRGFVFNRLRKLFGKTTISLVIIVLISSLWFGFAHLPTQGWDGAVHGAILGFAFGVIYAYKGCLFFLMIAHAAYDLLAVALIFFGVERPVSQFFFQ